MPAPFPHHYRVALDAHGAPESRLSVEGRPAVAVSAPPEFDGLPDTWSGEHLLLGAIATCFFTTLQSYARAAHLSLGDVKVEVEGTLEKTREGLRFTSFVMTVTLAVGAEDFERATPILEKAKRACIVANALTRPVELVAHVTAHGEPARAGG